MATASERTEAAIPAVALRPPEQVMRLERMGSFFATRISFMRSLIRRMQRENWNVTRQVWTLADGGFGRAVYLVETPHGDFSFVAFSHYLAPEERTDRVIAERWDATFTLVEGRVDEADLDRLEEHVPKQEAGQVSARELVLSRANKSVRLFEYVSEELAAGRQPDIARLAAIGYLMRTTAVYGNGKFGMGDFAKLFGRNVFNSPYQAEMLIVYLIRNFSLELLNHVAKARDPEHAVALSPERQRMLGIGNATGLGMAPFLVKHPILIHRWMQARETALARVRAVAQAGDAEKAHFKSLLERAIVHIGEWNVEDERQQARIETLRAELDELKSAYETSPGDVLPPGAPWDTLYRRMEETCSLEAQELCVSILIELYPDLVEPLESEMATNQIEKTEPGMSLADLKSLLERDYGWALEIAFGTQEAEHHFWYYSEGKEEPRRGARFEEPGADCEMRLGFGRDVHALHKVLSAMSGGELGTTTAEFLLGQPQWRAVVRRVQTLQAYPYGEIRDNLLSKDCLPIDMLRSKLSFFGATKFDPKSDLWTRITMFQGAPLLDEISRDDADDWIFDVAPSDGGVAP